MKIVKTFPFLLKIFLEEKEEINIEPNTEIK